MAISTHYSHVKADEDYAKAVAKAKAIGEDVYDGVLREILFDKSANPKVRADIAKYFKAIQYGTIVPQHTKVELSGNDEKPIIISSMTAIRKALLKEDEQ